MKNVLYISYDGLTDPLGQSQIIPYLTGLARLGHGVTVLSCEKRHNFDRHEDRCARILSAHRVVWHHVPYTKRPPVLSTWRDLRRMEAKARQLLGGGGFDVVHCRTVLSTLIGHNLRKRYPTKLVFDIRGFWADERVDGKLWNLANPLYRMLYHYVKRLESRFLCEADLVVTLTERARDFIRSPDGPVDCKPDIRVIPTCVDTDHFAPDRLGEGTSAEVRRRLGIPAESFVLTYLGSLGTRYLLLEMMRFFAVLQRGIPEARFLFVTGDEHDAVFAAAAAAGVDASLVVVAPSTYDEIPAVLSVSDGSIFFIRLGKSGIAVSPTKQAELLAMGVPVVCNAGIGDCDRIVGETGAGIVLESLDEEAFLAAAERLREWSGMDSEAIRAVAMESLSLESGVRRYHEAWESL